MGKSCGLHLTVDGAPVERAKPITYKGMMYSDVPNLVSAFGYTNLSWTLKCDLAANANPFSDLVRELLLQGQV